MEASERVARVIAQAFTGKDPDTKVEYENAPERVRGGFQTTRLLYGSAPLWTYFLDTAEAVIAELGKTAT